MPIDIDGSEVTGITIDGTPVEQVTADGDIVWEAYKAYIFAGQGSSYADPLLMSFDEDGNLRWTDNQTFLDYGDDWVMTISVSPNGFFYVGYRDVNRGGLVSKYDYDGNQIWLKELPNATSYMRNVEVDRNDNIIVGGGQYELFKYDTNGNLLWTYIFPDWYNDVQDIAIDQNNNIYVAIHYYVIKLDTDGNKLWETDIGDNVSNVLTEEDGSNVYGYRGPEGIWKMNSDGSGATKIYSFGQSTDEWDDALREWAIDANYLYLRTDSTVKEDIIKIDKNGNTIATTGTDSELSPGYEANITLDADGNVIASDASYGIQKFDNNLNSIWVNEDVDFEREVYGLAVLPGEYQTFPEEF